MYEDDFGVVTIDYSGEIPSIEGSAFYYGQGQSEISYIEVFNFSQHNKESDDVSFYPTLMNHKLEYCLDDQFFYFIRSPFVNPFPNTEYYIRDDVNCHLLMDEEIAVPETECLSRKETGGKLEIRINRDASENIINTSYTSVNDEVIKMHSTYHYQDFCIKSIKKQSGNEKYFSFFDWEAEESNVRLIEL